MPTDRPSDEDDHVEDAEQTDPGNKAASDLPDSDSFLPPRKYDPLNDDPALNDTSFFEELDRRPECELVGGPYDGFTFRWPDDMRNANLRDPEKPVLRTKYARDRESNLFRFQGWEKDAGETRE